MTEITIKEIEVQKLNLKEGDVLLIKLKGDDFDIEFIDALKKSIQNEFPNNKVAVLCMPTDHDVSFEVITKPKSRFALTEEELSAIMNGAQDLTNEGANNESNT